MRKFIAVLSAALIVALGGVIGFASPAFAHHNTITGSVACGDSPNTWTVTWTVVNSENLRETITGSNRAVIREGSEIGNRGTLTRSETVTSPSAITLTLSGKWTNGNTSTNSGSVPKSAFRTDCWDDGESKKISFCHNGNYITTSVNAFYNAGHINSSAGHENDIYPAGSFIKNGQTVSWPAKGDQSALREGCVPPPPPDACPSLPGDQPDGFDCDGPAPERDTKSVTGQADCSSLTVTSWTEERTREPKFVDGKWVMGDWSEWTKVEGSETTKDANGSQCDFYIETSHTSDCGTATVTLVNHSPWVYPVSFRVDGGEWTYGATVNNMGSAPNHQSNSKTFTFPEDSGTHTVEYVVNAGTESDLYRGKPVGQITTINVESNCQDDVAQVTVPTVTKSEQCGVDDVLNVPENTESVTYETNWKSDSVVEIKARAKDGYVFDNGKKLRQWTFTVRTVENGLINKCADEPVPATVTKSEECGVDDVLNVPEDTDQVAYEVNDKGSGVWEVKARAKKGYEFENGKTVRQWTLNVNTVANGGIEPCPTKPDGYENTDSSEKCDNGDLVTTETKTVGTPVLGENGEWSIEETSTSSKSVEKDAEQCASEEPPTDDGDDNPPHKDGNKPQASPKGGEQVLPNTGGPNALVGILAALMVGLGGFLLFRNRRA